MDRIDLFIEVPPIKYEKLVTPEEENFTQKIRQRVETARKIQQERFSRETILPRAKTQFLARGLVNSEMEIPQIKKYCEIDSKSKGLLKAYVDSGRLSARGYHRVLKVARTIADLEGSENILYDHLAEALTYRLREA